MGKGELAIRIGEYFLDCPEYDLQLVIPVFPEPTWTESFASWALLKNLSVLESGNINDLPKGVRYDLGFSCFYDKILTSDNLSSFGLALNLHNAPLPKYRGVNPINWALKNQEKTHGVTIHEITPGIDDGPIYGQLTFSIDSDHDEVIDVYNKCLQEGERLFRRVISRLDSIEAIAQDPGLSSYYSKTDSKHLGERSGFRRDLT